MNNSYSEIIEAMGPPKWWNEHAAPRYCDFSPSEAASIYADEVVLALIECQGCGAAFRVCFSQTKFDIRGSARSLASYIADGDLHYGDPPNIGCCPAGPTMNSIPRRVLEFWTRLRTPLAEWERRPQLEVALSRGWAT
jgi:hypothetical protein